MAIPKIFSVPRMIGATLAVPALISAAIFAAPTALADTTETGPDGQELTVSQTALDPEGQTVTVTGTGYRDDVGIYVALCVIPEGDAAPGPCLGGVNMEGEGGASYWIATDPPAYAEGLTIPYGTAGDFEVELEVAPDDGHTDCLDPAVAPNGCAISTRADHTRDSDRSADVLIPVTFDGEAGIEPGDEQGEDPENEPSAEPDGSGAEQGEESDSGATDGEPTDEPDASATTDEETPESEQSDGVQNEDSDGNSAALIIGIAAGAGLIAGIAAVVIANRRKRAGSNSEDPGAGGN